jgi:hypothetical protein
VPFPRWRREEPTGLGEVGWRRHRRPVAGEANGSAQLAGQGDNLAGQPRGRPPQTPARGTAPQLIAAAGEAAAGPAEVSPWQRRQRQAGQVQVGPGQVLPPPGGQPGLAWARVLRAATDAFFLATPGRAAVAAAPSRPARPTWSQPLRAWRRAGVVGRAAVGPSGRVDRGRSGLLLACLHRDPPGPDRVTHGCRACSPAAAPCLTGAPARQVVVRGGPHQPASSAACGPEGGILRDGRRQTSLGLWAWPHPVGAWSVLHRSRTDVGVTNGHQRRTESRAKLVRWLK